MPAQWTLNTSAQELPWHSVCTSASDLLIVIPLSLCYGNHSPIIRGQTSWQLSWVQQFNSQIWVTLGEISRSPLACPVWRNVGSRILSSGQCLLPEWWTETWSSHSLYKERWRWWDEIIIYEIYDMILWGYDMRDNWYGKWGLGDQGLLFLWGHICCCWERPPAYQCLSCLPQQWSF